VAEIAVGKYFPQARRRVHVRGTRGEATLDRDRGELQVVCGDGLAFTRPGVPGDTGYDVLARALLAGEVPAEMLNPLKAVQALRLVEQAHLLARPVSIYGEGSGEPAFVCDWEMAAAT
jgi:hypothetical protein